LSGLDRSRLFETRTVEVGLLGDANQQGGRRSVDARSTREWSSEAAARPICPNS